MFDNLGPLGSCYRGVRSPLQPSVPITGGSVPLTASFNCLYRAGPKGVSTKGVFMKRSNLLSLGPFYTAISKRDLQKSPWSWIPLLWWPFWSLPIIIVGRGHGAFIRRCPEGRNNRPLVTKASKWGKKGGRKGVRKHTRKTLISVPLWFRYSLVAFQSRHPTMQSPRITFHHPKDPTILKILWS